MVSFRSLLVVVLLASVAGGCRRTPTPMADDERLPVAPGAKPDPDAHIFQKKEWIDSCMKSCTRNAPQRLSSLSEADRKQHCSISCACGLTHMTDPGPGPTEVHAPSKRWQSENEEQHKAGVKACLDRATAEVAASHGHPG